MLARSLLPAPRRYVPVRARTLRRRVALLPGIPRQSCEDTLLSVMILICAGNLSHADCRPETAISVTRGPRTENQMACGFAAQSLIASTQLLHEGDYLKIVCQHRAREAKEGTSVVDR